MVDLERERQLVRKVMGRATGRRKRGCAVSALVICGLAGLAPRASRADEVPIAAPILVFGVAPLADLAFTTTDIVYLVKGKSVLAYGVLETSTSVVLMTLELALIWDNPRSAGAGMTEPFIVWSGLLAAHGVYTIVAASLARDDAPPSAALSRDGAIRLTPTVTLLGDARSGRRGWEFSGSSDLRRNGINHVD